MQDKFYKKNWFIWLMIILFFPLGIFLLFKYSNYSLKTKNIITLIVVVIVIACRFVPAEQTTTQTPKKIATEQTVEKEQPQPELICQQAGIGDTLDSWKDEYGSPEKDNDMTKTFKNDRLLTVFADDRALNIIIQNNKNGKKDNDLISKILPTDIKKISEEDTSSDTTMKHKEIYHSDLIKKVIPKSDGTVTVIDQFDKKSGKYLTTTIDCTPNI